jgi:Fe-S oxidoreductase
MAEPSDPFSPGAVARQLDYCTFCPKMCRHACPVSTASGRETHIPQAKMDRLNQIRLGRSPWTPETTDPLWACTGCRHCTMYCDHEPARAVAGRAEAVQRGAASALTNLQR